MSDRCHFDVSRFLPNLPAYPTCQQLADHFPDGAWRASCLRDCGNLYDPSTFFQGLGVHVEAFQQAVARSSDVPDGWADALERRYGEQWLRRSRFNCDGADNLPPVATAAWGSRRPETLMAGFGMIRPGCRAPAADISDDHQPTNEP